MNGKPVGFFSCKRGVRQGDPLSPLHFCLAEDALSCGISYLVDFGMLNTISGRKNSSTPSHALYADDVMVFYKGSKRNLETLMNLINDYSMAYGQHLSLNKCKFYTGSSSPRKMLISQASLVLVLVHSFSII